MTPYVALFHYQIYIRSLTVRQKSIQNKTTIKKCKFKTQSLMLYKNVPTSKILLMYSIADSLSNLFHSPSQAISTYLKYTHVQLGTIFRQFIILKKLLFNKKTSVEGCDVTLPKISGNKL